MVSTLASHRQKHIKSPAKSSLEKEKLGPGYNRVVRD
jgi:hypothetical protein